MELEKAIEKNFQSVRTSNVRPEWLSQRIHDNTVPPVEVHLKDISDVLSRITGTAYVNAFAVQVQKSKRPGGHQTIAGLAKIRDGNRCLPYYYAEDDRTKVVVTELAASYFMSIEWGIEQYCKKFGLSKDQWGSPYDFLLELGVLERYHPQGVSGTSFRVTLAGLLLFGKQAALRELFPCCESLVITPESDHRSLSNVVEIYRDLCAPRSGRLFELCRTVPPRMIKELVVNALIHRSYRVSAPMTITLSRSDLQIESPGELPGELTPDTLIHCMPIYRNFLLAEGARFLGICDKIGRGIDRVYEDVLSSGFGFPAFESSNGRFLGRRHPARRQ